MAASMVQQRLGDSVRVESAGIHGLSGHEAAHEAVVVAREHGMDLREHRARHVREIDLRKYDLIIALTPSIAQVLREEGARDEQIVGLDVADPFGSGVEEFRRCFEEIERQIDRVESFHER